MSLLFHWSLPLGLPVLAVGAFLLTPFGAPVLSFLLTSKIGRTLAIVGVALLTIGIALGKIFKAGENAEAAKEAQANLKAVEDRHEINSEVQAMPDSDVKKELSTWSRG